MVDSVKGTSDVFTPVAGEVVGFNAELAGQSTLVNTRERGRTWSSDGPPPIRPSS